MMNIHNKNPIFKISRALWYIYTITQQFGIEFGFRQIMCGIILGDAAVAVAVIRVYASLVYANVGNSL